MLSDPTQPPAQSASRFFVCWQYGDYAALTSRNVVCAFWFPESGPRMALILVAVVGSAREGFRWALLDPVDYVMKLSTWWR